MNSSVAKKTQDTLGKVIKKPPLTEKLLGKPPFRYLHDIVTEVIRTTGFMKGLYEDSELKSDNVKDKDSKIAFLQKAIDVVALVCGEPLAVRPARIVAGHEAEKTNELLQAIGRCCLSKLSSEEAVRRVLLGEKPDLRVKPSSSKSKDKENQEDREHPRDNEPQRVNKERSSSRDRKELPKDPEGKRSEKDRPRDAARSEKRRERERTKERDRDRDKDKERDLRREKDKERDREKRRERDKERERHEQAQGRQEAEESERRSRGTEDRLSRRPPERPVGNGKQETEDSPMRIPRPSSAKGQRRLPKPGGQDESDSDGGPDAQPEEKTVHQENGDVPDSHKHGAALSGNRGLPRPSSARPAPPRVKRQEVQPEVMPMERLGSAKPSAAVIMDGGKPSEDEEDEDAQFVVEEAAAPPPEMPALEAEAAIELQENEKHGGLVKKILETKKDYETSSSPKSKDQERTPVSEAARKKERDLVSREVERLRASVQTVCRSALPLGRIMDYIQEDVDSMQAELQMWRRENQEHGQALVQEHRITESTLEPLQAELVELEQLIREQQDKICTVKSNILRNEEKIRKIVSTINSTSRT
ncbi:TRAF3-interacting protein 1 isoform X2 [Brienomyrus brachyistius]|uniref:TRAF3-interacting protein 1 isoform X2 n=1 Tax=Brienomyrus brachyistius TaxID=42636 RepID=UPI0020B3E8D4|nr:TRAF3-interacting protein 1 isoform X2 [Brienomyrus brachyistius]